VSDRDREREEREMIGERLGAYVNVFNVRGREREGVSEFGREKENICTHTCIHAYMHSRLHIYI
jgi:hypothetical protein